MMKTVLSIAFCCVSATSFAWGELGHHLISRTAGRLISDHPLLPKNRAGESIAHVFQSRRIMMGHLGNIPDTYWRAYDKGLKEEVSRLGDPTHYFNLDLLTEKVPLDFSKVKAKGSLPWRAQQFYDLYVWFLQTAKKDTPARDAQVFAGLLSHYTEDVTMPLHAHSNFDGQDSGQKGVHWYFESDLVDALDPGLEKKVLERALALITPLGPSEPHAVSTLRAKALELYPDSEKKSGVVALMLVLLKDSLDEAPKLLELDKEHALTEKGRRHPQEIAGKFEPMIVERLALATAVTTDLWVRGWLEAGSPMQNYTWDYAHKPAFVSPDDPNCFGYFPAPKKKSKLAAKDRRQCLRL